MQNQLQKAIKLVQRTGDRLIVVDENGDDAYVVMNLNEYEKLVNKEKKVSGLTEEKLIDNINRDIALWKNKQYAESDINDESDDYLEEDDEEEFYNNYNDRLEDDDYSEQEFNRPRKRKKKRWSIPKNVKKEAEEIIDEDAQYLEGLPF